MTYKYTPFDKEIEDISPEDLETLRDVHEGWYVEYKSELISSRNLAKSLSAFANQYGGWLFIGISEVNESNVAGDFPGIPDSEVTQALEILRNSSKDLLNPAVFYETRVFQGPIKNVGLQIGYSVIVVRIPQGSNTPYVHNDGRIYQRVADSSDPKPATDRSTLDFMREENKHIHAWKIAYTELLVFLREKKTSHISTSIYFLIPTRLWDIGILEKYQNSVQSCENQRFHLITFTLQTKDILHDK